MKEWFVSLEGQISVDVVVVFTISCRIGLIGLALSPPCPQARLSQRLPEAEHQLSEL